MTQDLFSSSNRATNSAPLAARMRPRSLDEVVGHEKLAAPGSPLRRLLEAESTKGASSLLLWGPPGSGKTTLAMLAATASRRHFVELSAVNSGVAELRRVIDNARNELELHDRGTILFVDEIHRFSKTQQDALLPAVERGWVVLIAATTENPSFSVVAPLLSRSLLLTLTALNDNDIIHVINKALTDNRGLAGRFTLDDDAIDVIVRYAQGDLRRALTALEAAAGSAESLMRSNITLDDVRAGVTRSIAAYDRQGDQHYDVISAFIKSLRGSDADAALHYLARMIASGEDPRFIARRLVVHASEDVGMADPTALQTAIAAAHTVAFVGMPEAQLALAQATIHIALAPKSNAITRAIGAAMATVERGGTAAVPPHLRDAHYSGASDLGHGAEYLFPHHFPEAVVQQQYLPDSLTNDIYYLPTLNGRESTWGARWQQLRNFLRGVSDINPNAKEERPGE